MRFFHLLHLLHAGHVLGAAAISIDPELLKALNATIGTTEIPGFIKDEARVKAAKQLVGNLGSQQGGVMERATRRDLLAAALEIRQQCPATHPVRCPNNRCCQTAYPNCCNNGKCCANATPVCSDNICCPTGMSACGTIDPSYCKPPGSKCCGSSLACLTGTECCGTKCCNSLEKHKCCPGSTPGKSVCCEEYQTCCDGYCCPEGATCTVGRPGYCTVPTLTFGWSAGTIVNDLVENACLGFRSQLAMGRPNVNVNSQIVTYAGPGSDNRQSTDCKSSRKCCQGRTVPPGEPGAGDVMSCEEYPFNSVEEGGAGATCSCVNDFANAAAGNLIGGMVAGKHKGFKFLVEVVGINCAAVTTADIHPCNP